MCYMYLNLSACLNLNYMSIHIYIMYVYIYVYTYSTTCVVPVVKKEFICLGMWFICPYLNTEKSLLLSVQVLHIFFYLFFSQ